MICVICAMQEELDALLGLMDGISVSEGQRLFYHGEILNNAYYKGRIEGKEIVATRSGVGMVYATIAATNLIRDCHPELVINLGVAGSLHPDVHVNDIVVADQAANWRFEVPGWDRKFDSVFCSFPCDAKAVEITRTLGMKHVKTGPIVSADEFIRYKRQTKIIKKYYPEALAGEMEGAAVANTCYAHHIPCAVIRSISDETLVNGGYKEFDFNLSTVCKTAAALCREIIKRY